MRGHGGTHAVKSEAPHEKNRPPEPHEGAEAREQTRSSEERWASEGGPHIAMLCDRRGGVAAPLVRREPQGGAAGRMGIDGQRAPWQDRRTMISPRRRLERMNF